MIIDNRTETIACPYCFKSKSLPWAKENGFTAVKCSECGLIYVNPRPVEDLITNAVETGIHSNIEHGRTAIARREMNKTKRYKKILSSMFSDVWQSHRKISWLDVGAGYGEILEAIDLLAEPGSRIEGIEPMKPKMKHARERGLKIIDIYLNDVKDKYEFISLINVYSHIPDFRKYLEVVKDVLADNGELWFETGNIGDLATSNEAMTELDLPDHLVFAGEKHLIGYLSEAGFSIMAIRKTRRDGLINFGKNMIKRIIGRNAKLAIPYTSRFRSIFIRAKLCSFVS